MPYPCLSFEVWKGLEFNVKLVQTENSVRRSIRFPATESATGRTQKKHGKKDLEKSMCFQVFILFFASNYMGSLSYDSERSQQHDHVSEEKEFTQRAFFFFWQHALISYHCNNNYMNKIGRAHV